MAYTEVMLFLFNTTMILSVLITAKQSKLCGFNIKQEQRGERVGDIRRA